MLGHSSNVCRRFWVLVSSSGHMERTLHWFCVQVRQVSFDFISPAPFLFCHICGICQYLTVLRVQLNAKRHMFVLRICGVLCMEKLWLRIWVLGWLGLSPFYFAAFIIQVVNSSMPRTNRVTAAMQRTNGKIITTQSLLRLWLNVEPPYIWV